MVVVVVRSGMVVRDGIVVVEEDDGGRVMGAERVMASRDTGCGCSGLSWSCIDCWRTWR